MTKMIALAALTTIYFVGLIATLTHAMHIDGKRWF